MHFLEKKRTPLEKLFPRQKFQRCQIFVRMAVFRQDREISGFQDFGSVDASRRFWILKFQDPPFLKI